MAISIDIGETQGNGRAQRAALNNHGTYAISPISVLSGGRGSGHCPGGHFRRTRPWVQATGEWRAEGSSLDKKFSKLALVFIVSAFICGSLQAIMIKLPLSKLTLESDIIVFADVLQVEGEWSGDRRMILSAVSLRVDEVLKGKLERVEILIQVPGGKVGDIGLRVSDMPDFTAGEKVLVFLREIPDGTGNRNSPSLRPLSTPVFQVFGAAQGKYRIEEDGRAWKNGYELLEEGREADRSLALSDLKGMIRNILERSRGLRGKAG